MLSAEYTLDVHAAVITSREMICFSQFTDIMLPRFTVCVVVMFSLSDRRKTLLDSGISARRRSVHSTLKRSRSSAVLMLIGTADCV